MSLAKKKKKKKSHVKSQCTKRFKGNPKNKQTTKTKNKRFIFEQSKILWGVFKQTKTEY